MKIEIYQIGKVTPTVLECDSWSIDCGNTPKINTYKDRKRNAVFFVNNIAGFKEINEDDEIKEATTEETKRCPWCQDERGKTDLSFGVLDEDICQPVRLRMIKFCPFCGRMLSDDNG